MADKKATKELDTGGPAFPNTATATPDGGVSWPDQYGVGGMTLLDYFAGLAMEGQARGIMEVGLTAIMVKDPTEAEVAQMGQEHRDLMKGLPKASYDMAEAMIAERKRRMQG